MENLLDRALKGDKEAENQLFQYLLARFKVIATHLIRNETTAEDLAQEACLTILEKYKNETFSVGFEAWVIGVLRMKIRNYWQRMKSEKKIIQPVSSTDYEAHTPEQDTDGDLERRLLECFQKLFDANARFARVLNLVYQGYKTHEITTRLGLTRNNLYSMLSRGRAMLRYCLETGKV